MIGSRTYGKGSVQELIPLEQSSGELKMTVAYYYLPSGRLVHRRKDATDWGVIPQIQVNVDPAVDQKILRARYETEYFRKPGTSPSTAPATQPYGVDVQLQRAMDSMMALLVLQDTPGLVGTATTEPTTQPATQPDDESEAEPFETSPE